LVVVDELKFGAGLKTKTVCRDASDCDQARQTVGIVSNTSSKQKNIRSTLLKNLLFIFLNLTNEASHVRHWRDSMNLPGGGALLEKLQ
jgi:23S rRNA G2445 N2-methylase RlmL